MTYLLFQWEQPRYTPTSFNDLRFHWNTFFQKRIYYLPLCLNTVFKHSILYLFCISYVHTFIFTLLKLKLRGSNKNGN